MKSIFYSILPALVLTGCVNGKMSAPLVESHPGNPEAASASYPPLTPFLMSDTNLMVTTAPSNAPEMNHENHGAKSAAKPAAKPEHKHDHD